MYRFILRIRRLALIAICLESLLLAALPKAAGAESSGGALKLWYTRPAAEWTEALPIGNGRLGAMLYGGLDLERLQLNEDTLWSGGPHCYDNPDAYNHLDAVRDLLDRGKYAQAEATAAKMLGQPIQQMAYQPLGDLYLRFPQGVRASGYRRELDLQTAVSTVSYEIRGARYTRRVFASHPDQVIVVRLECSKPGRLTFDLFMASEHDTRTETGEGDALTVTGRLGPREEQGLIGPWAGDGLRFAARVEVHAEAGTVLPRGEKVSVRRADAVTLIYSAATSYIDFQDTSGDPIARVQDHFASLRGKSYDELYQRHLSDYAKLFDRVSLVLCESPVAPQTTASEPQPTNELPTDERLKLAATGQADPTLEAMLFQYGRYMMICGSRPGSQPLTLQGIWNNDLDPHWGSKYTININIQMNYWVAEVCNLSECHEPLLRMTSELQSPGSETARTHYRAGGWVAHHNTDLWRGTAPVDGPQWGTWPTGGAWLCQHLWEHFLYTGDTQSLKRFYPTMRGAAEFFMDVLVETDDGYLITSPSISPEHSHGGGTKDGLSVNRKGYSVCAGPAMDRQIIDDLFANCLAASEILGIDQSPAETGFLSRISEARSRLAPMQIGRHGQLQEWLIDWDNPADKHSHISHLYAIFPSRQINWRDTPELFKAARTSLIHRGDGAGWPGAWRICLWARLGDGNRAHNALAGHVIPIDGCASKFT